MLSRPDERTIQALKRLRLDSDFQEILAWLEHSLVELDHKNRGMMDAVVMRQTQGAAQVLDAIISRATGKVGAITKPTPVRAGEGGEHL
jgi:hypothetical protein